MAKKTGKNPKTNGEKQNQYSKRSADSELPQEKPTRTLRRSQRLVQTQSQYKETTRQDGVCPSQALKRKHGDRCEGNGQKVKVKSPI